MTERVNTGGAKVIEYPRGHKTKRDAKLSQEIRETYHKIKKRKQMQNAVIYTIIAIFFLLLGFWRETYFFWFAVLFAIISFYWIWRFKKK